MNLIQNQHHQSIITQFKVNQYLKIDYMIDLGIRYLQSLGLTVDPAMYPDMYTGIRKVPDVVYSRIRHYATTLYVIKLDGNNPKTEFLHINIPDLIEGTFFQLNHSYYIPILYITDEPIVVKENSITIQSLFQPMTMYFKEERVIFMGNNYVLSDFINFITYTWSPELRKHVQKLLNVTFVADISKISDILAEKLNCLQDYNTIKWRINQLFFDEWTANLYNHYYNINTFDDIIMKILYRRYEQMEEDKVYKFNDLRHKRLIFIEMLLKPYFKAISSASKALISGHQVFTTKLKAQELTLNFFNDLHGNSLYDTSNGFSGILAHKATFKNPYGSSELPKEVASIHWTHKNRICPNSISNKDSGQDVFLVPNQDIDLEYGIFKFKPEEMELES